MINLNTRFGYIVPDSVKTHLAQMVTLTNHIIVRVIHVCMCV